MIRRALGLIVLTCACAMHGDVLFKHSGEFAPGKDQTFHNTIEIPSPHADAGVLATSSGERDVHLTISDAHGKQLWQSPLNARPAHIVLENPAGPLDLTVAGSGAAH